MNYIFQVRHWNLDFFVSLEKFLLSKQIETNIVWLTMEKECFLRLNTTRKNVFYLPELFSVHTSQENTNVLTDLDNWMYKTYGYSVEFIYEMERFKPDAGDRLKFIQAHLEVLNRIIPEKSKFISLTCDHFVYYISAYINKMKAGTNYFVQPCGFPLNAQVIMENPFDLLQFRTEPLDELPVDAYIISLSQSPMESIHYMKPQKLISLKASFYKRIKKIFGARIEKNMFTYLEVYPTNIIPSRFRQKKHIPYKFNYIQEKDLQSLKEKGKIFYYPLQFEPEMSIMAYSPWFKSQLEVIRLISQSLKQGDILLLKENPKMIGSRDKHYYKEVYQFSQVLWADPTLNSRNIIRNSYKVISITGTAAIEAACLGVNSMIWGYPPFHKLLIERPIANQRLSDFTKILYKIHTPLEITDYLRKQWPEFSKSVFFGNFVPEYIDEKFDLKKSETLASIFYENVLF